MKQNVQTNTRIHYIPEWAAKHGLSQADICRELGADKGVVSRWFNEGNIPSAKYLDPLVTLFHLDEIADLFRDPEDDWLARLLRGATREQKQQAASVMEVLFKKAS